MSAEHETFMRMAIEEARAAVRAGERPFGSVVVLNGEVVGRGRNVVNSTLDPTAHAETTAIRDAAANLKTPRLTGGVLYTSCHPCPMCAGATLYSGAEAIVIGAGVETLRRESKGTYDLRDYRIDRIVELTGLRLEIVHGVLEEEAAQVFREYKDWDAASPYTLNP